MDLSKYIDRCFVINLKRRTDRLEAFNKEIERSWPFPKPEVFAAIEGDLCQKPDHWKSGGGAWGCRASWLHIMEQAMSDKLNRIFVLEDDAMFVPNFAEKVERFIEHVPKDAECLMVGGQDHASPKPINDHVARSKNCQRTHGIIWCVQKNFMRDWYRELQTFERHIDHRLGSMMKDYHAYQPHPYFLIGQSESRSDIFGKKLGKRWWSKVPPADVAYEGVIIILHAPKTTALTLRTRLWHQGYWCDKETGIDNGLKKILSGGGNDITQDLRDWIDLVGQEVLEGGYLTLWHPKITKELVKKVAPKNKIVDIVGNTVEECLLTLDRALATPALA